MELGKIFQDKFAGKSRVCPEFPKLSQLPEVAAIHPPAGHTATSVQPPASVLPPMRRGFRGIVSSGCLRALGVNTCIMLKPRPQHWNLFSGIVAGGERETVMGRDALEELSG